MFIVKYVFFNWGIVDLHYVSILDAMSSFHCDFSIISTSLKV